MLKFVARHMLRIKPFLPLRYILSPPLMHPFTQFARQYQPRACLNGQITLLFGGI